MGLLGFIWAVAGASGPLLGGVFTEFISWRWIFWINLPISGTAFLLLFFFLDVHNPRTPLVVGMKAVDWFGTLTILGLMVMLLLGLDFGGTEFAWKSPTVVGLIVAGGCMGGFFLWSEKSLAKYPLMPLGVFRSRSNVACLLIAFFHDFVGILYFSTSLLASMITHINKYHSRSTLQQNTTSHSSSSPLFPPPLSALVSFCFQSS